jgi:hypothetical protein
MAEVKTIAVMGATGENYLFVHVSQSTAYVSPGKQGRGVVNALSFAKGSVRYEIRPMTRSTTSKLAQAFSRDYPQLPLVSWDQNDVSSIQRCFEGCHGAFITTGSTEAPGINLRDLTKAEMDLAERCLTAAKVGSLKCLPLRIV